MPPMIASRQPIRDPPALRCWREYSGYYRTIVRNVRVDHQ